MKSFATLVLFALALFVDCAAAQAIKIGYIDTFRIERESAPALRAAEEMKREFTPRQKDLEGLQAKIIAARDALAKASDKIPLAEGQAKERAIADMVRRFEQARRALTEDLELRKNQERAKIAEETNIVIKSIADAGKYDLIVQQAIYSSHAIDITPKVLKELAKRTAAARK
jgi:outer membrane protein